MTNHDKILALAENDPTIRSMIIAHSFDELDWTGTLELLVLQLAAEKKQLFDKHVEILQKGIPDKVIVVREP